jgi:hypothetical protein
VLLSLEPLGELEEPALLGDVLLPPEAPPDVLPEAPPDVLPEPLPDEGVELEAPPLLELGEDELEVEELESFFSVSDEDDGGVLLPAAEDDEEPGEDGEVGEVLGVPPVDEPLPDVAPLLLPSLAGWSQP